MMQPTISRMKGKQHAWKPKRKLKAAVAAVTAVPVVPDKDRAVAPVVVPVQVVADLVVPVVSASATLG